MKILKLRKMFFVTPLFSALLMFSGQSLAQTCSNTGSSTGNRITETTDCFTQPDIQQVTFYKIALCTAQPTAPTTSAPVGLNSCVTVFQNSSGSTVNIQKGTTNNLVGQFTRPLNASYSYLYMEISPSTSAQKVAYFNGTRNNSNSTSSGTKCWSIPASAYANSGGVVPVSTTCGADGAATTGLGLTTTIANSLDGARGFVNARSFPTTAGPELSTFLIDSSGKLVASAPVNGLGTVAKVAGYMQQSANVTQQNLMSLINIYYNNSLGTLVSMGGGAIGIFSGGPFDPYLGFRY